MLQLLRMEQDILICRLCLFQVIEYSDDEEESKARASRKKQRY